MEETKFTIENLVKALLALTDEDFCEPDEETYVRYAKTTPALPKSVKKLQMHSSSAMEVAVTG